MHSQGRNQYVATSFQRVNQCNENSVSSYIAKAGGTNTFFRLASMHANAVVHSNCAYYYIAGYA